MRMTSNFRAAFGVAVIAAAVASPAFADDLTGAYVGAGVGLGRVQADLIGNPNAPGFPPSPPAFDQSHLAYHLDFGIHPPGTPLALELEYFDLGQPNQQSDLTSEVVRSSISQRGGGLFLLYYLPTPIVQAYVKAGGSRITTHADFTVCNGGGCSFYSVNPTNNSLAYGAGVQWALGAWAVRGEYERFNAGGGHPSMLTAGIAWTFL